MVVYPYLFERLSGLGPSEVTIGHVFVHVEGEEDISEQTHHAG